jgi:hypothetical protein
MSIFTVNNTSSIDEIIYFYNLYSKSYSKLCIYNGKQIVDLSEYLSNISNETKFIEDVKFIVEEIELVIHYTHNNNVITCISFIEKDNINNCYVIIKFLCGNIDTREIKIDGKSQGNYMLDYIFREYKDSVILIEPASRELIPYYTKYKKPSFPYKGKNIEETYNFLIYGNLSRLNEKCFEKIFNSIRIIKNLEEKLNFHSINDLYDRTNDIETLKMKLNTKLVYLIRIKEIPSKKFNELNHLINSINYYNIDDLIIASRGFETKSRSVSASGITKKRKKINKVRKNKKKSVKKLS